MRFTRFTCILVVLAGAAAPTVARADIAQISFEGVIDRVRGDAPSDVVAGQTLFSGILTVDTDTRDRSRNPSIGDYRGAVISGGLSVGDYALGDELFQRTLLRDDVDRVTLVGRPDVTTFGGRTLKKSKLQFTDSTRDVLDNDSLSQLLGLSLSALDSNRGAVLTLSGRGELGRFKMSGHVLSMNVSTVPAPGAALLAAAGFALVGLIRRRRLP